MTIIWAWKLTNLSNIPLTVVLLLLVGRVLVTPKMSYFALQMFQQKSCFIPILVEQISCFALQMLEQIYLCGAQRYDSHKRKVRARKQSNEVQPMIMSQ